MSTPIRTAPRRAASGAILTLRIRALAVSAIVLGLCAAAPAQWPWHARGAWPPITVSVSVDNGWVVASGNVQGTVGPPLWRAALAPAGPAVAVRSGFTTTFVTVGPRQFVVDDASGRATELHGGAVYRQWGQGPRPLPSPPPIYVSAPAPSQPPSPTPAQQEALQIAAVTQNRLQAAIERLNNLTRTQPPGSAELAEATLAVQAARIDVSLGMARVKDEFGSVPMPAISRPSPLPRQMTADAVAAAPRPPPSPRPALPPPTKAEVQAHDRLLQAQADLQIALMEMNHLRGRGVPLIYLTDAGERIPGLRQAEEEALVAYRQSQLEAEIDRAGARIGAMDLPSRYELYESLHRVLRLTRDVYRAEAALGDLHAEEAAAGESTLIGTLRMDRAASDLAQALKGLESARKDFATLLAKGAAKQLSAPSA